MKFSITLFALAAIASLTPSVYSHGFLASVQIDGKVYEGNNPDFIGTDKLIDSPIRLVDSINPIKGAKNVAVNCGANAAKANLVVDANPGSNIAFNWSGGSSEHVC